MLYFFKCKVRTSEHNEIDGPVAFQGNLLKNFRHIVVGDDYLPLRFFSSECRLHVGRLRCYAENMIHSVSAGGVQLRSQVPERFLRDSLSGKTGKYRDSLPNLLAQHTQDVVVVGGLHICLYLHQDIAFSVLIQQKAVFRHKACHGCTERAVGALTVASRSPYGIDIRCCAGL